MGKESFTFRKWTPVLAAALSLWLGASAGADTNGVMLVAQADCYAIGEQVAAQNGATLAKAQSATQGGQQVCVIVLLVPGKDGQRPRRKEIVVPAG